MTQRQTLIKHRKILVRYRLIHLPFNRISLQVFLLILIHTIFHQTRLPRKTAIHFDTGLHHLNLADLRAVVLCGRSEQVVLWDMGGGIKPLFVWI